MVMGTHPAEGSRNFSSQDESDAAGNSIASQAGAADMVPMRDISSFEELVEPLILRHRRYTFQAARITTIEEIEQGPVLLIGGLDNPWTLRLTRKLPYTLESDANHTGWIFNHQHKDVRWGFNPFVEPAREARDYAIVAGFFDTDIQQHVVIVAGIGKNGTAAAAEFLSQNTYFANWLAHIDSRRKNFEVVLATDLLNGDPSPPQVLQSLTW
ncbi:hypothetical protein [Silvibacterium sp.]|uniref:hypothetical protein n=1 Tax=Silvibacterium sp. TaxID=1964179 RepID=UPI0039E2F98F